MIVAVLGACVLYPASLRDLFMWLAAAMVYEPRWTEEIHAASSDTPPSALSIVSISQVPHRSDAVLRSTLITGGDLQPT